MFHCVGDRISTSCFYKNRSSSSKNNDNDNTSHNVGDDYDDDNNTRHLNSSLKQRFPKCGS